MAKREPDGRATRQPVAVPAPAGKDNSVGKPQLLAVALIVVAALLAYHNSFTGAFVFDDIPHIVDNPRIRHLWPPWEILTHSSRPVMTLSLAVNYALGGLNPWGYHAFNVAGHILAALVLYGIVRRTLLGERLRSQFGTAAEGLALAVALIWAVHPLQTESVNYVIQRGESLMGLFYLLTLYCVIHNHDASPRMLWKIGAVVCCTLGMACKPVMVTGPLVVLLYDRVFLAGSWRQVMERRWGLYAGLAATWLMLAVVLADAPPQEWKTSAGFGFKTVTPLQYALTQPGVIVHYLQLALWPRPLCLDYGWRDDGPEVRSAGDALPELIVVGALLAGTVWACRRKPALGFLGAWFFIILAPTSSFIPIADVVFEHRMYLPLAAVVTVIVASGYEGLVVVARRMGARENRRRLIAYGVVGLIVVTLGYLTVQRNKDYRSELSIWADTVAKRPQNARAHCSLGLALAQTGKVQEAIAHYEQALRLNPDYADAHYNLGTLLGQTSKMEEAIAQFELALRNKPDYAEAHNNLGAALLQLGQSQDAITHYEQALRIKPDLADAHYNLGIALEQTGNVPEAIAHYEQALRIKPDFADAHYNLGIALEQTGNVPEAIAHFEQALRLKPDLAEAHVNLGNALLQLNKVGDAIWHFEQALRLKPDLAEAHVNLGIVSAQAGKIGEAIAHYEQALRIKPDYAEAHYNLGVVLEQTGNVPEAIKHYEQALRIKPDFTDAQNALARLQARQ